MNNTPDYDEMFKKASDKPPKTEAEKKWEDRYKKDLAERNRHSETVERFRNGPKHHESFLDRSEGFAEMAYGDSPPPIYAKYSRRRYYSLKRLDFFFEYIDSFAVAALLGVVVWMLFPYFIPVSLAAAIGFIAGTVLKLKVHDRFPANQVFRAGLPIYITVVISEVILLIVYYTNK